MATKLPALPRSIFNPTLYRQILNLWFEGHDVKATAPTFATTSRWFAIGPDEEEKAAFDAACLSVSKPALDFLAPDRYPLPAWKGFDVDRANAAALSQPLRELITTDGAASKDAVPKFQDETAQLGRGEVALALILLLDQFPRDVFRDVNSLGQIYSHYDRLARALAYGIVGKAGNREEFKDVEGLDITNPIRARPPLQLWFYMPLEHSESVEDHDAMRQKLREITADADDEGKKYIKTTDDFEARHHAVLERFGRYPHRNEALGRESTAEEKEYLEGGGETFGVTSQKASSS